MASDTTSQTTHQTNTLKALSTLTLYNLICVIRAFIDIGTILQLASSHYNADVVNLHMYILWFVPYCLYKTVFSYLHNTLVFYHIGIWCEHAFCIFPAFSTASIKKIRSCRLNSFLDTCSLKKHFMFIQHMGRCHLFLHGL